MIPWKAAKKNTMEKLLKPNPLCINAKLQMLVFGRIHTEASKDKSISKNQKKHVKEQKNCQQNSLF